MQLPGLAHHFLWKWLRHRGIDGFGTKVALVKPVVHGSVVVGVIGFGLRLNQRIVKVLSQ